MNESTDSTANGETSIPPAVGSRLQRIHGLDSRPETITEWGRAVGEIARQTDIEVGLEALCTTDESPHMARFDGTTQQFVCVQDAFVVPAVVNDVETLEIETESPVSGGRIEVSVDAVGDIDVIPDGAVMSFGVAAAADGSADPGTLDLAYEQICPYGHGFLDREEYEQWAETVDAETMVAPLESAIELATAIDDATL